jgi:hypothetical protein
VAARRTPGVYGILEDGFPSLEDAWPLGRARPHIPSGPARDANYPVGVVEIETIPLIADRDGAAQEDAAEFTIPDRYRNIELQGHVVKVRCNPRWLSQAKLLMTVPDPDGSQTRAFLEMVKLRPVSRRATLAEQLVPLFRARDKGELADTLERLAQGQGKRRSTQSAS